MNDKECAVCKQMMKAKHKFDKFYRIGFWIVLLLFGIVLMLYISTGDVIKTTEFNNSNNKNVMIENSNNNEVVMGDDNGSYIIS